MHRSKKVSRLTHPLHGTRVYLEEAVASEYDVQFENCDPNSKCTLLVAISVRRKNATAKPSDDWSSPTEKRQKPPFAATKHIWIYAASDQEDARQVVEEDRENLIILDRSKMWDSTKMSGCQSHYE